MNMHVLVECNSMTGIIKIDNVTFLLRKLGCVTRYLGPVVLNIVSLTTSLRPNIVKYMLNTYKCTIFPTKNNSVFDIFVFKLFTKR